MIKRVILKVYQKLTVKRIKNINQAPPNVEEWMIYLDNLSPDDSAYQRSYNKYLCRRYYLDGPYVLAMQVAAFFTLYYSWIKFLLKGRQEVIKNTQMLVLVEDSAVPYKDIFPEELEEKYKNIHVIKRSDLIPGLYGTTKRFFWDIYKNRPFNFYYNYLILRELSFYSALCEKFDPEAVVVYVNERNIASPLLRQMLESKDVEWVSFMHGDYVLQLIQAYMSFTTFYVWDDHYAQMFRDILKVDCGEYKVYIPKKLQHSYRKEKKSCDVVYYLGIENKRTLEKIAYALNELENKGWCCRVRPHPRSSDMSAINKIFPEHMIENPLMVTAEESLASTHYAASLNSTVLMQAYYGGIKVLIDDYSDKESYYNLEERRYIMLNKEHGLLSEFINLEEKK